MTEGIYPKFIDAMKQRMAKIKFGDALAAGTDKSVGSMRINKEEIFGPVASVIRVKNYEEALPQGFERWPARAGQVRAGVLHHREDGSRWLEGYREPPSQRKLG